MLSSAVQDLFNKNLTDYQKGINYFVLKVCLSGGILGILFFSVLKVLGILNKVEWSNIKNFSIMSIINLSIPLLFYLFFVRRNNKFLYVNIFKYILLTCATINYFALISNIPYHEMWGSIFLVFFLSSFYLEVSCVIYSIILSIIVCTIAVMTGNSSFIPANDTFNELLIRGLGFSFGAACSIITAFLSKKLLMMSSGNEYESNQSLNNLKVIIDKTKNISDKLSQAGLSVTELANQQNQVSEEIAQKSSCVSQGTVDTANSVEKSVGLIDKLFTDVRFNMEKVNMLEHSSKKLQEVANEGMESVTNAVDKITFLKDSISISSISAKELNQKAKEIDTVVEFIRQIANQTNLLSLNASIEAARAGEQGKGFSVVANEIRTLAEQSHESLKTISNTLGEILTHSSKVDSLMEDSVSTVEDGVNIVRLSNTYYQRIIETLSETITILSDIRVLSEDQLGKSQSLSTFIQTVNGIAQSTSESVEWVAASTEESFAASEELIQAATIINNLANDLIVTVK